MSRQLISRSPDLQRLENEGYNLEIRSGYLLVRDVPYPARLSSSPGSAAESMESSLARRAACESPCGERRPRPTDTYRMLLSCARAPIYSLRKASIGSRRAACAAGWYPNRTPTRVGTMMATGTESSENWTGRVPSMARAAAQMMIAAQAIPTAEPAALM